MRTAAKNELSGRRSRAASQERLQPLFPAPHDPGMVRSEERLHQKRKEANKRLGDADAPIKSREYPRAGFLEGPDAAAVEVAVHFGGEAKRKSRLDDFSLKPEAIGQVTADVEPRRAAGAHGVAVANFLGSEKDLRPPARIIARIDQDAVHLFQTGSHAPVRDQVKVMGRHLPIPP